jgi:hypothetical protein
MVRRHTVSPLTDPMRPRGGLPSRTLRDVTITLPAPAAVPAPAPTGAGARPRVRRVSYEPGPGPGTLPVEPAPPLQRPPDPVPPAAEALELDEAHHGVARILRLALEVLDGRRPVAQLGAHFAPAPLRYWRVATEQRRPRTPARFSRMRLCLPRSGVAEVAAACSVDGRVRALAARFEHTDDGWCCTVLRLG